MRLIITRQDGFQEVGILGGFIGGQVRVFVPGSNDAVAFRFAAGRWIAENGDAVQIRFGVGNLEFDALLKVSAGPIGALDVEPKPWFLVESGPARPALVH
jgi:hypothetical protein